ncbi:uncharacterized protein LOC118435932 [Folsomia candida]|uniref:uncharacterized protein LOC118435932 n=1 Tax=Folsomia candida TaxID=158441 RepID=UPI001604AF20|nr:uncharacterized protein LOC118435932 [Folsomia candida]
MTPPDRQLTKSTTTPMTPTPPPGGTGPRAGSSQEGRRPVQFRRLRRLHDALRGGRDAELGNARRDPGRHLRTSRTPSGRTPLTFLADTATGLGYSEGAMLGSTIGLLTVFGNIILGYLGDKKWANSVTIYGLCISICGIVTGLMPCLFGKLFSMGLTYYFLVLLCGVFGLMIAANYSLTPVILLQVVSLEKFTPAYGLLLLVQGIGN